MYLQIGSLLLDDNEVNLAQVSATPVYSQRGKQWSIQHVWLIRGITHGTSQSNLTTKLGLREAEFLSSNTNRSITFYIGPGATNPTIHTVSSTNTYSGVQCKGFSYLSPGPWFSNTEYVWIRSWQVTVIAEKITAADDLYSYQETIEQIGDGGIDSVIQESMTGTPQLQVTKAYTKYMYRQQGIAVKVGSYYAFPAAIYPSNVLPKATRYWKRGPQRHGTLNSMLFPCGWHYLMHSTVALGLPDPGDP